MELVLGECYSTRTKRVLTYSVRAMHQYRLPAVTATYPPHREDEPLNPMEEPMFEQPEDDEPGQEGELVPYAHRDIKPANVMLTEDDTPILMDFGSTIKYVQRHRVYNKKLFAN